MNYSLSCDFKTTPPSPTFLGDTANFITCVEVFGLIVMETFLKAPPAGQSWYQTVCTVIFKYAPKYMGVHQAEGSCSSPFSSCGILKPMFFPVTMTTTLSFIMESQHILSPWASGTGSTPISLALYRTPTPLKRETRTVWGAPGKHDERSQRVFVRLKKGTPQCICVGLVQITFFHVTIKARVYLSFSWCPCMFITGQTVVFGTKLRLRVQTESWFKKENKLKSGKYNFRGTGIWLRSGALSPFLKGKQLFGKYERLTDRYPLKGHLLNSLACIVLGFTGFEWMFSSVLSTNMTVLSNNKTQIGVAQKNSMWWLITVFPENRK